MRLCKLYKVGVAIKQLSDTDVYGLDASRRIVIIRGPSWPRPGARTHSGAKNSGVKKCLDILIALILFAGAVFVVLYHMGEIPQF